MSAFAGVLPSEAMLPKRAAHFVRYPGTGYADHIITVRSEEYEYGLALLHLRRRRRTADRAVLQAECTSARASLRVGRTL